MHSSQTNPSGNPRIVVVGGVDPGGGAGLLRDVATAVALGAQPHAVGTAWTEQGPGVHRVEPREPEAVKAALVDALRGGAAAVKVGMAVGPATAAAIIEALAGYGGPVVVDPVLATSRGGALWEGEAQGLLPLLRRATLVTPNAPEAAALTGAAVTSATGAEEAGRRLLDLDLAAALIKGGHLQDEPRRVTDVLITRSRGEHPETVRFSRTRLPGHTPRGTGCTLATAIAVELARGHSVEAAIGAATDWLAGAIAAAGTVGGERQLP